MSLSVGIIGLPNVGKSTLFKALTKQPVNISNYPFCTIDPNVGIVIIPDKRLKDITQVIKPKKITPTVIEFVDIAGLVKNAHQGEGLGNQFLAHIREVDAICQIVRDFTNEKVSHVENEISPKKDIETINTELIMKDLEVIDKRLEKVKKQARSNDKKILQELEILNQIKKILEQGKLIFKHKTNDIEQASKELGLITSKPMIYVLNISNQAKTKNPNYLSLDIRLELETSELSKEEQKELELPPPKLNQLIKTCYQILDLITFYTITGGKETKAWTLKKNSFAPQAGRVVHSDFEEKFIRAEVINWKELIKAGNWQKARVEGILQTQGKEYIVKDGDVIEFKI